MRKCPIVLLDEPTASLDRESENAFLQGLASLTHDKTVVMVAHRAELIAFAGKVITVEPKAQPESDTAQTEAQTEAQPNAENAAAEVDHA